jgi:hypothetical protein
MARKFIKGALGTNALLIKTIDGFKIKIGNTYYDIMHNDMSILITDNMASLYKVNGKNIIDHSPKVLGYTIGKDKTCRVKKCTLKTSIHYDIKQLHEYP